MDTNDKKYWKEKKMLFDVENTLSMHQGYYEKGIHRHKDAVINMNSFIERLIQEEKKSIKNNKILDAGCGVGGTVMHLAKKHPDTTIYGLNITPEEINLAKNFANKIGVNKNTKFVVGSYENTNFLPNYFDAIIALESVAFSKNKEKIILEAKRILKPGGKLIIIDVFLRKYEFKPFIKKMIDVSNIERKMRFYNENEWRKENFFKDLDKVPDLESIRKIEKILISHDFQHIQIKDITKRIRKSFIRNNILVLTDSLSNNFLEKRNIEREEKTPSLKLSEILQFGSKCIVYFLRINRYYVIITNKNSF